MGRSKCAPAVMNGYSWESFNFSNRPHYIVAQDLTAVLQQSVEVATVSEAATMAAVSTFNNLRMVAVMLVQDQATQQTVVFIDLRHMDLVVLHQRLVCISPSVFI